MPAHPYIMLSTCQGGEGRLWRKQLLLPPLYVGLNESQEPRGLGNPSVANGAPGSAVVWDIGAAECVIQC